MTMNCKFCQSPRTMKYGCKAGTQYYKCNACGRKFAGRIAPEGMRFSHASSIIEHGTGSAKSKIGALKDAGAVVVEKPIEIVTEIAKILGTK